MVWLGFIVGRVFGWTPRESIFAGAIIAISSTTIIAKAFDEQGVKGKLRELLEKRFGQAAHLVPYGLDESVFRVGTRRAASEAIVLVVGPWSGRVRGPGPTTWR